MSNSRQSIEERVLARTWPLDMASNLKLDTGRHGWGQIVFTSLGVLEVRVPGGEWIVPPMRAIWLPQADRCDLKSVGKVSLRCVYLPADVAAVLSEQPAVMSVEPLVRELLIAIAESACLFRDRGPDQRLIGVLLDRLATTAQQPFSLRWPTEQDLLSIAECIARDPEADIESIVAGSGWSRRTLERRFGDSLGISLGRWRRQAALKAGLSCLAQGGTVQQAACDAGYSSASAFIVAFRSAFGCTPKAYFG